jgi:hypothetical protein
MILRQSQGASGETRSAVAKRGACAKSEKIWKHFRANDAGRVLNADSDGCMPFVLEVALVFRLIHLV